MDRLTPLRLAPALAALLFAASCDRPPPDGTVRVAQAWVRLPPAPKRPGAAYFRLEAGSEGTRLLGVSTPAARWVELHEMRSEKGVARMRKKKEFEFPAQGRLVFEPGGNHAMLFGLNPRLKPGDVIPLTFSFNVAPPVTVEAEVRAAGATDEKH
jgi:periplasmic copper chaperone A